MLGRILCLACLITSVTGLAQSPGNVSNNLRWWLKANAGVYTNNGITQATNGQLVQQWNDQSSVGNNARQTTNGNKPSFATNQINGNPSLHFTGNDFITALATPGINSNQSFNFFLVVKQDSYLTNGTFTDGNGTFIVDRSTETDNLMSFKIVDTNKFGYQKRNNTGGNLEGPQSATVAPTGVFSIITFYREVGSSYGIYIDGRLDAATSINTNDQIAGPVIQLGRHAVNANQGLNGDIAEVIVYNGTLTQTERTRIESYLAIKYGIALDQTTLTDYLRSNGNAVYPVASDASFSPYKYNIAGIARENVSGLIQSSSQNQSAGTVLQVSNPTSLANGDFLLWGSDNGDLATPNRTDVDGALIERRLDRVWRSAETNNVGNVTLTFDLSAVPGAKVQNDLRLLIDRDGDGFADNDITPKSGTLTGSLFTITGVNLNDGDYFTVGTINSSTTPLPIELLSFELLREDDVVVAEWKTASEKDNDFFTLERSADGSFWEAVDTVTGHGNSVVVQSYESIDPSPLNGKSYYRIKQTDLNGNFSYSSIRSVSVELQGKTLSFFPNPGTGKTFYMKSSEPLDPTSTVQIVDSFSKRSYSIKPKKSRRGPNTYLLEVSEKLPPGLYFITLKSTESVEVRKMIVR